MESTCDRYHDRRSRGVCVDCARPSNGAIRCVDCAERLRAYKASYEKRNPHVTRNRMKRLYAANPEKFRERQRQLRLAKKLRGECQKCPEPCTADSNYCAKHLDLERARRRDYNKRKAAGLPLKKGGRRPGSGKCDCGEPLIAGSDCCARCAHLDGVRRSDAAGGIINVLRGTDGLSLDELCTELLPDREKKSAWRQMHRWVHKLMGEGRIRRYWLESTNGSLAIDSYRSGKVRRENAKGCWVYTLNGATEREWRRRAT